MPAFVPTQPPLPPADYRDWVYREFLRLQGIVGEPRWNDVQVSATTAKVPAASGPTWTKWLDNGAGSNGIYLWAFSPTTEQELYFSVQFPHGLYKRDTIRPHFHFVPSAAGTGTVRLGVEYVIVNPFDQATVTTLKYAEYAINNQQNYHIITGVDDDPSGIGMADSTQMVGRIFRDATHANDTYGSSIFLMEFDIHVQVWELGSRQEYPGNL